jgi:hypothetical protein
MNPSHRRRRRILAAIPLVAALAFAALDSIADGASTANVHASLGKPGAFSIVPSQRSLAAGKVTFSVANRGSFTHELIVIPLANAKTSLPKGKQLATVRQRDDVGSAEASGRTHGAR